MASLIAENSYLIPEHRRKNYAEENIYLLVVTDLEKIEDDKEEDVMAQKVENLQVELKSKIGDIKSKLETKIEDV
jgi:hypothetical protein